MARLDDIKVKDIMAGEIITARPESTVTEAIALMQRHGISEVPVLQDSRVVGMVTDETFLKRRHLPLSARLDFVMSPPPTVEEDDDVVRASSVLVASGYRGIPVVSGKGDYVGFLSKSDIISSVPDMDELKDIPVMEVMGPEPITVNEHSTVEDARITMMGHRLRVIPVVDDDGMLAGMVGIKDIVEPMLKPPERETRGEFVGEKEGDLEALEVRGIMSEPPVTVAPDEEVQEAARLMSERDVSTLPVVEDGEIKGLINQLYIIELIASYREAEEAYVQITGLEEGLWEVDAMHDSIQKYLRLFGEMVHPRLLDVHVSTYRKGGRETKYSIRLRLQTDKALFHAHKSGWNIVGVLDEAFENMRREVVEHKERHLELVKEASRR